jgi:hypothetical protein
VQEDPKTDREKNTTALGFMEGEPDATAAVDNKQEV